jgi:ABC-type sugar transport system ATPase subunit
MTEVEVKSPVHLEVRNISKRFGATQALADVSITFERGRIHGLIGENGAGKSTLGKIICGVYQPDKGQIFVAGRAVRYLQPRDAMRDKITIISQELMLQPYRSVAENVFLGIEHRAIVSKQETRKRFVELAKNTKFDIPADARVGTLSVAVQQQVAILRSLARNTRLIVMDEPTAPLTSDEAEKLFENIRRLREFDITIIYISHFLNEVLNICETVSVLRDGQLIHTSPTSCESPDTLVSAMLGRQFALTFPERVFPRKDAPVVFSVEGLSQPPKIVDISLEIREGEILGLVGFVGSGRTEIVRAIFGADHHCAGIFKLDGKPIKIRNPHEAIAQGIAMLPESRAKQGLLLQRSIIENLTLPHLEAVSRAGIILGNKERQEVSKMMHRLDVRASHLETPVRTLSGGNQQKVLFGKWLLVKPRLLLADEPTRGIDVGSKRAIYNLISSLAKEGMAVLLISSEHEEVLELAHRILVIRDSRVVAEFAGGTTTMDAVLPECFSTSAGGDERKNRI